MTALDPLTDNRNGSVTAQMLTDPVCGMIVDATTTNHRATHAGCDYYFCGAGCQAKFIAQPDAYLNKAVPAQVQPGPASAVFTCPMHPKVRRSSPGICPICGMALEPEAVSTASDASPELADMTRRFWIGLVLTLPVFTLEMGGHLAGLVMPVGHRASNWIQFVLATPVVLWAGWPFFARGWASLKARHLKMFTLIAMGVGVAYLYSLVAHFAPSLFPPAIRDAMGTVPVYFEAAAVITVLVLLGQVLELRARERTSGGIKALLDLAPRTARRITADGADEEVTLDRIMVGDTLRVRPCEKVPVNDVIVEGRVAIDESLVTGESMPVIKEAGASVIAGSMNKTGSFTMVAQKVGSDTLLSRIVQKVATAQPGTNTARDRSGFGLVRACRYRGRDAMWAFNGP